MPRTGEAAVQWSISSTADWTGRCLTYVREAFDVLGKYSTATQAWQNAQHRHPGDRNPPRAVPLWFSSAITTAGHVTMSLGGGELWTDGWPTNTTSNGETSISELERSWRATYLGWSEDINDVVVYDSPNPPTPPSLKEENMQLITRPDGAAMLISGQQVWGVTDIPSYQNLAAVIPVAQVTDAMWARMAATPGAIV